MTGYNRKQIAEMIQRYVVGGNVSVDAEFYMDEVYPIIDSFVVSQLSKGIRSGGKRFVNEMWLKKIECEDLQTDCSCGKKRYFYTMPVNYLPLPNDDGVYLVEYVGLNCERNRAVKTTIETAAINIPSIAGIMPTAYYIDAKDVVLTRPAKKIIIHYLPVTADLGDDDFVALVPDMEQELQTWLHDYFAGRGNAPKDRIGNQMDVKQ